VARTEREAEHPPRPARWRGDDGVTQLAIAKVAVPHEADAIDLEISGIARQRLRSRSTGCHGERERKEEPTDHARRGEW
jgi:hypothetical protein